MQFAYCAALAVILYITSVCNPGFPKPENPGFDHTKKKRFSGHYNLSYSFWKVLSSQLRNGVAGCHACAY